jgi:glycosyltransferase involved in cell wall biosynthesis
MENFNPNAIKHKTGLLNLIASPELREGLGRRGRQLARENYSLAAFRRKLAGFYQEIGALIGKTG